MKNPIQHTVKLQFLAFLFFMCSSTVFGQGITLQGFSSGATSHQGGGHNEKCGHTLLEAQQERELDEQEDLFGEMGIDDGG